MVQSPFSRRLISSHLKTLKVGLLQEVQGFGRAGQVVNVAPGYARNKLIPDYLALPALPNYGTLVNSQAKAARSHLLIDKEEVRSRSSLKEEQLREIEDASKQFDVPKAANPRYPSFKHKTRKQGLDRKSKPLEDRGTTGASLISWNKKLARCVKAGQFRPTIKLFHDMLEQKIVPDTYTFVPVLKACTNLRALPEGQGIHSQVVELGLESDMFVSSALVNMYSKCGNLEQAQNVFNKMTKRDVVSWTSMILGYVQCKQGWKALQLSQQMEREGLQPDLVTFLGLLSACASIQALEEGRRIHSRIIKRGFESGVFMGSCLVDMYSKCGSVDEARRVFDQMPTRNVVVWNAIIQGYAKSGREREALALFWQMQQEGVQPDSVTFLGALNACAGAGALNEGRRVHDQILREGHDADILVGSCLIDMYAKCGSIDDAWKAFKRIPTQNTVSWTAMILGFVKCGQGRKGLELYQQMTQKGVPPDSVTFVGVLNACASITALEEGRHIHEEIKRGGFLSDVSVGSSLVDMYAKCGSIEEAEAVFAGMAARNVVSWTAMLGGYAMHGLALEALCHFERMCQEGADMNGVTFLCLLAACSHGGLVNEGLHYFGSITSSYGIPTSVEHCACVVDLLGRAGRLHEAADLIKAVPLNPDATIWTALLGNCRIHGNLEMGEIASKRVLDLEPKNVAGYVLLSNMYASAGMWDSRIAVEREKVERRIKKVPGKTWIVVDDEVHAFTSDDQQHPQLPEIHAELGRLAGLMKADGYLPDVRFVLEDVSAAVDKESHLCHHSERLAFAFGHLKSPPGVTLRIFKNLRVCGDCHTATKFFSKITGRTIIVRDANRFHHFEDGRCSCNDYW